MEKWKQTLGQEATYSKLIGVFEHAGYKGYAETVRKIVEQMSSGLADDSSGDESFTGPTPPSSPSPLPQLPVFPAPNAYMTYTDGTTHFTGDQKLLDSLPSQRERHPVSA